jgi:biofilm PGA synthesis protein PgaA
LIEQARAGRYEPALTFLRGQQTSRELPRYLADHLLIASWAGKDDEVVALYERYGAEQSLSADVLAGVARSYRNLRQWPQALALYRRAVARFPEHQGLRLGQVMVLADAGQSEAAIAEGRRLVAQAPEDADRRLVLGYVYQHTGQPYAALFEIDRAHELVPGRVDVDREYLLSLQRAGLAQQALMLAQRHPQLTSAGQLRQLQGDVLAEQVRLAEMATRSEAERFRIADQALAEAQRLLQAWDGQPDVRADSLRVRIDRLGALHSRMLMEELLTQYRQLHDEGIEVPDYALRWVASAYLYLRQPEQAATLYRQVIAGESDKDTEWLADHRGLFHALVESEQLDEARQLAERLAEAQAPRVFRLGQPEPEPNGRWLEAQELLASAQLQADGMPGAEQALTQLADNAPNNASLRVARASLYLSRGWPRRAEAELKAVESTTPRDLALEVEQGLAALTLQEWRQLELLSDDVIQRYPESLQAQRLRRLHDVQQMAELQVSGYRGEGSGGSVSGSRDLGIDTLLYSAPLLDDWRLFGGGGYAAGDFEEGRSRHRWLRGGIEWRVRNHSVEAELSNNNFTHGNRLGARLSGIHDIDDHWQYGWSAQRLSTDTPLRALNADITADSLGGFLRWRADERREWRLSANAAHFSDDNDRLGLVLEGRERLYSASTWQADLGLELSGAHNSGSVEVPYFNPESEFAVLPSVQFSHRLYRRYQTVWTQELQLGIGSNTQQGYGTDAVGLIGYGQRLRFADRFDGGIALSALSRAYDGEREHELRVLFNVNYRF